MSLTNEERQIIVNLELEKAKKTYEAMELCMRGVMALFGEHFVRTGIFTKSDGALFSDLVIMRDNADYNCFFEATEEKLNPYIEPTRQLIEKIKRYIADKDK